MRTRMVAAAFAVLLVSGGCGSTYYRVTDPTSGKTYYTTNLKEQKNGAATLTDARTGSKVSLQNTEVTKVSKEEYDVGRYATTAEPAKQAETTLPK
jgi:hypothetical protein